MNLLQGLFSRRVHDVIDAPPDDVDWISLKPKPNQMPVRAWRAEADCDIRTKGGALHARGGEDYIVQYPSRDRSVVRGDIFERTYEALGGGLYRKRSDYIVRSFVLDGPALVHTLEGVQTAEAGDCVLQGTAGEMWTMPAAEAAEKYEPA